MNLLSHFRLSSRLGSAFGLVLCLLLCITAITMERMRHMDQQTRQIAAWPWHKI